MQQMHTHKAVTRRVEAKKLLSRQRQSEYNSLFVYKGIIGAYCFINIQNLESSSNLWDCKIGLNYSSVPINQLFNTKNSFLQ